MADDIIISQFSKENFSSIVELMKSTYPGHEISDERYLFWEYSRNPDGKAVMNIASASDGQTVSQYAVLPRKFTFRGKALNGSVSVNTITHPDYRGKNLFPKLASETFKQCGERDILFTIGFPNPVSLPIIVKKDIFILAGSLAVMFRPINPIGSVFRYFKGKKNKRGDDIPLSISIKDRTISLFDITSASADYNKILTAFNKREQITTHRNVEFFKWRYVDIPRRTYYSIKQGEDGIEGVLVFRSKFVFGMRCLVVVDIMAVNQESIKKLLKEVGIIAKENEMDIILSAVSPFADEYETLKSSGYFSIPDFLLPQKPAFIIRKHRNDCPDDVMHFGNWFLTFGDYDIF